MKDHDPPKPGSRQGSRDDDEVSVAESRMSDPGEPAEPEKAEETASQKIEAWQARHGKSGQSVAENEAQSDMSHEFMKSSQERGAKRRGFCEYTGERADAIPFDMCFYCNAVPSYRLGRNCPKKPDDRIASLAKPKRSKPPTKDSAPLKPSSKQKNLDRGRMRLVNRLEVRKIED